MNLMRCLECNEEFIPKHKLRKFCTARCRHKHWRNVSNSERYKLSVKKKREKYRDKLNLDRNKRHHTVQSEFRKFKESQGCSKCGYNKCGDAIDFHHINSHDKKIKQFNPQRWYLKDKTILDEIEKCILVCKNCHAEIHFKESRIRYESRHSSPVA